MSAPKVEFVKSINAEDVKLYNYVVSQTARRQNSVSSVEPRLAAFRLAFEPYVEPFLVPAGMASSFHFDARAHVFFLRLSGGSHEAASMGLTGGYCIRLPDEIERQASGRRISVKVSARASNGNTARFAIAYSTNEVGNSGWHWFDAGVDWADYSFIYSVNEMKAGNGDFVGLLAGTNEQPGTEFSCLSIFIE